MECKHELVRRGESWGGTSSRIQLRAEEPHQETQISEKDERCVVLVHKTNLSRSASLSEKELKEARTKSQIIAAQLQAKSNSKGVQLFHRRRQRVNAFTLVSIGGGPVVTSENVNDLSSESPRSWDKSTEDGQEELNKTAFCKISNFVHVMDEPSEIAREDLPEETGPERHFLPVNEKDEEVSDDLTEQFKEEVTLTSGHVDRTSQDEASGIQNQGISNGYGTQCNGKSAMVKQTTIVNRTARPFFSPTTVGSSEATIPLVDIPPALSYDFPTSQTPAHQFDQRAVFSPPPPPPSYPTPPLPNPSNVSHSPSPQHMSYHSHPAVSSPTITHEMQSEKRSETPVRTGILDEGRIRRGTRKSMFTFQEKPTVAPSPELLSLVQVTDERKKPKPQPDPTQEEELLALGAEASNFQAKHEQIHKEATTPEWASSLKSSRTRARIEHKPEQALTNASGKGAELFAKRQTRMERFVHDKKDIRSPSPTMSLPPSWVFPSNMPGRVKAIVSSSNISAQISKTLQAQQVTQKKTIAPKMVPAPPPEIPLENGCSKIEMELSKHQPYQLNSSLFIFNPTKDPYSTLPRSAPKSTTLPFSRQTSLPTSPLPSPYTLSDSYRSSHCFSPPMMPLSSIKAGNISSPVSPDRVASPRSGAQAPRPTFSAKKAGIAPQVKEEIKSSEFTQRFTSPEVFSWAPSAPLDTHTSQSPIYKPRPIAPYSNHKPIATNTIHDPVPVSPISTHKPIISPIQIYKPTPISPFSNHKPIDGPTPVSSLSIHKPITSPSPIYTHTPSSPSANHKTTLTNLVSVTSPISPSPIRKPNTSPSHIYKPKPILPYTEYKPTSTFPIPHSHPATPLSIHKPTPSPSLIYKPTPIHKPVPTTSNQAHAPASYNPVQKIISTPNQNEPHTTTPVSPNNTKKVDSSPVRNASPLSAYTSIPKHKPTPTSPSLFNPSITSPVSPSWDSQNLSPTQESKTNHRILAKNIINAAKRKNSPSPGTSSALPISPVMSPCGSKPLSPFQPRILGTRSPILTSPSPPCLSPSPVCLYASRSLTDSDASVDSEDSGGRSFNASARGWSSSLRVKRGGMSEDL